MIRKEPGNNLGRFVEAQTSVCSRVLRELRSGQKVTHWMWFIFPQVAGPGYSPMARRYALRSVEEAREYLAHPVLGPRLRECFQCILAVGGRTANDILDSPDDLKLRSTATLFAAAAPQELLFSEALQKFYGGPDLKTLKILGLIPSESR